MPDTWYYIDSGQGRGSWNMAVDTALAKLADKTPYLRFYGWTPYCLSIGYGQSFDEFSEKRCKEEKIDAVRRPTGGRAILHSEEVTYSVALSDHNPLFNKSILEFYRYISTGLSEGLRMLGVDVAIEKSGIKHAEGKNSPAQLCFSSVGRYELKVKGKKIAGSAQRRFPTCLLQHGSLLLGEHHLLQEQLLKVELRSERNSLKEFTTSISAELQRETGYNETVEALRGGFEKGLNIKLEPYNLSEEHIRLAKSIEQDYALLSVESSLTTESASKAHYG